FPDTARVEGIRARLSRGDRAVPPLAAAGAVRGDDRSAVVQGSAAVAHRDRGAHAVRAAQPVAPRAERGAAARVGQGTAQGRPDPLVLKGPSAIPVDGLSRRWDARYLRGES